MINLPDEIRLGTPGTDNDARELRAETLKASHDVQDGRHKIDVEIALTKQEYDRIAEVAQLDVDLVRLRFDVTAPQSSMPPDPMGPAGYTAAAYYINAVQSPPPLPAALNAGVDEDWLMAQAVRFLRNVEAAIQGAELSGYDRAYHSIAVPEQPRPTIPAPVTLSDAGLQQLTNALLVAAAAAVAQLQPQGTAPGRSAVASIPRWTASVAIVRQLHTQVSAAFAASLTP